MKIIGLTGGIATGKSTVSSILKDLDIQVIDADTVARELSKKGNKVWSAIYDNFGSKFFLQNGELDRGALGELVFSNCDFRDKLNKLTHPIIQAEILTLLQELKKKSDPAFVTIDVPLLIESGWSSIVDEVWVVAVPRDLQLQRLMQRDGFTREQAELRINSQMSLEDKCDLADKIIDNSSSIEYTKEQILDILKNYETREDIGWINQKGRNLQ